jgi:short subunit dehydrogenase-like uncharacterized protein
MNKVILYGAYGYTGKLIANEMVASGIFPLLSGRNESKLREMAGKMDLSFETVSLDDPRALQNLLKEATLVVHAAGPFSATARPMIEACLATKTHYIDITGEWEVYEYAQKMSQEAREKGIMLMPGAGFDVVPSDCLSVYLKQLLPTATRLRLAFTSKKSSPSRGTAKTMIEGVHKGQAFREAGVIKSKPLGKSTMMVDFGEFKQICTGISWGDISSAYASTGIPDIEVFMGASESQIKKLRLIDKISFLFKSGIIRKILKKQVDKRPEGPDEQRRKNSRAWFWGQVTDGNTTIEARLQTNEGYTLTADATTKIAERILKGNFSIGYQTPASAFGPGFITELPGSSKFI